MIVPVDTEHVGCVSVIAGVEGVEGCKLIVALVPDDMQADAFFAVTVYVPVLTELKIPVVFEYVVPSILYVMSAPVGEVIVIVPVDTKHVG